MKKRAKKRVYIRCCDLLDGDGDCWDVMSGNSDALCNEDSSDPDCAVCEHRYTCKFCNNGHSGCTYIDWKLSYPTRVGNRKKKRNTYICSYCVYNDMFHYINLSLKEIRKVKLEQINREQKYGKVEPGNHYGTPTYNGYLNK